MNKPTDMWQTTEWACLLEHGLFILAQSHDSHKSAGIQLGSVRALAHSVKKNDWVIKFYDDQDLASCCLWPHAPSGIDFRCVLSEEGQVRLYGPGGKPDRSFQLPDAGVFRSGAAGYGYVNRIRTVGTSLYVCGAHRQVYRYMPGAVNPLSGQFVDAAGPMRQPPLPKPPAKEGDAFSAWADLDIIQFNDIAGLDESDIYATGDETWHFDGTQWHQLSLKVTDETMHVIKVLDAERILIGGSNGYLFMGNARQGFTNISSVDDNFTITGLEWFEGKLFIATDQGLFTLAGTGQKLTPYTTGLIPELQDAHLLEAKDGVLWSFGYKDLAYLDTNQKSPQWVRVHHPDNPRIGDVQAKPAARSQALAAAAEAESSATATPAMPVWLSPKAAKPADNALDVDGLIARVGHSGVGGFVLAQLSPFGLQVQQILQVKQRQRYTVAVPGQGVALVLQYEGPKRASVQPESHPEHWALAEVRLQTMHADASSHWRGRWPGGLDPYANNLPQQLHALWGEPDVEQGLQKTYFVDGSQGAAWVVNLEWTGVQNRLGSLKVLHLGGYLPWAG